MNQTNKMHLWRMVFPILLTLALLLAFLPNRPVLAQEDAEPAEPKATAVITATATLEPGGVITTTPQISPTATATMVAEPTKTATPEPTATPLPTATPDFGRDQFEQDSLEQPMLWTGTVRRSFSPAADVDYVLYFVKPGRTEIRTKDLSGAADTVLEVWAGETFLASDDDSGEGLSSFVTVQSEAEMAVTIIIRNKAVGFGSTVGYTLEIVPEQLFTPTSTLRPTNTPTQERPTATLVPIQPTQTPVVVTATPTPTDTPAPVSQAPAASPTPSLEYTLRVDVFIDADRDEELDSGEGINGIYVEARTLDTQTSFSGYTQNGIVIIEVICPPGSHSSFGEIEVLVPYLQRSTFLDIPQTGNTIVTNFPLEAAVLPIQLP